MRRLAPWALALAGCSFDPAGVTHEGAGDDEPGPPDGGADADAAPTDLTDATPVPATCPPDYADRYRYTDVATTWSAARDDCADDLPGATYLVVIGGEDENALVDGLTGDALIWVGATDADAEGTWVDVLGAPQAFELWGWFEPNNGGWFGGEEDCAEMADGGIWNDQGCDSARTYLCECDLAP